MAPGAGGQAFSGNCVRPMLAVVGSAMQTFPIMGCAGAPASRTSPVDARNPNRRIDARRRALSLAFNYRQASSALQFEFIGFRNIYALGEQLSDLPSLAQRPSPLLASFVRGFVVLALENEFGFFQRVGLLFAHRPISLNESWTMS